MKTLANYLLAMFMLMYWVFRIIVVYMAGIGKEFIVRPINYNIEVVILFITLVCMILVVKRKAIGGIIYVLVYGGYFGVDIFQKVMLMIQSGSYEVSGLSDIFFSAIGMILALAVMIDLLSDHMKKPDDKKTEWFFANKDYDRKLDDRADKNNYKLY